MRILGFPHDLQHEAGRNTGAPGAGKSGHITLTSIPRDLLLERIDGLGRGLQSC